MSNFRHQWVKQKAAWEFVQAIYLAGSGTHCRQSRDSPALPPQTWKRNTPWLCKGSLPKNFRNKKMNYGGHPLWRYRYAVACMLILSSCGGWMNLSTPLGRSQVQLAQVVAKIISHKRNLPCCNKMIFVKPVWHNWLIDQLNPIDLNLESWFFLFKKCWDFHQTDRPVALWWKINSKSIETWQREQKRSWCRITGKTTPDQTG